MAILFLTIFILIGILFAFRVYTYENSEFRKMTGYSLLNIWTNPYIKNTYLLVQSLKYLQGEYKLLLNLAFPTSGGKRKLDAIVIHESGIYVFNIQHKNGWVYGREQDEQWAQATNNKNKLIPFANPIIEMKKAILDLQDQIANEKSDLFHLVILFTDNCSFKKIVVKSNNVSVMKINEMKHFWKAGTEQKMSAQEIDSVYQTLKQYTGGQNTSFHMNHATNH